MKSTPLCGRLEAQGQGQSYGDGVGVIFWSFLVLIPHANRPWQAFFGTHACLNPLTPSWATIALPSPPLDRPLGRYSSKSAPLVSPLPLFPGFQHPRTQQPPKIGSLGAPTRQNRRTGPPLGALCNWGAVACCFGPKMYPTPRPGLARIVLVLGVLSGTQNGPLRAVGHAAPPPNAQTHRMQPPCGCFAP